MPVIRVTKDANYTTMSNYHLRDMSLSLKAKGLLSMFLSLPKDWTYSVRGLAAISKEGVDGILSGLKELEAAGYLVRRRTRDEHGKLGDSEYSIYETPMLRQSYLGSEKPNQDMPNQANPNSENPEQKKTAQLSKERLSKELQKKEHTNNRLIKGHRLGAYRNVIFTDAEFNTLQKQFPYDYEERIERLSEYMASTGKTYENHLATIQSWARKDGSMRMPYTFKEGESL